MGKDQEPKEIPLIDQLTMPDGVESFVREGRIPYITSIRTGDSVFPVAVVPPYGIQDAKSAIRTLGPNYIFYDAENKEIGQSQATSLTEVQRDDLAARIQAEKARTTPPQQ